MSTLGNQDNLHDQEISNDPTFSIFHANAMQVIING